MMAQAPFPGPCTGRGVVTKQRNRRPLYDPEDYFITITDNQITGHHTPLFVRFPWLGNKFDINFAWMSKGDQNNLFYVPRVSSKSVAEFHFVVKDDGTNTGDDDTGGYRKFELSLLGIIYKINDLVTKRLKWHEDLFITRGCWKLDQMDEKNKNDPLTVLKDEGKSFICFFMTERY